MAYTQFGYAGPTVAPSLSTAQLLMSGGTAPGTPPVAASTASSTSCCESGRPIMTDPTTGQTICSCQYSATTSLLSAYPRSVPGLDTVYGSAYAAQGYVPFGGDPSAFYAPLNPAYDLKDGGDAWRGLAHPTPCYPYDPMSAGYPYGQSALAQRKNATREATSTLKAWLQEHIKNPYPTKGEKIMLAIITKMTLTQVSTWFANARRRLKKENKMVWSPRNRTDEDGNKIDSDDEGDGDKDDSKSNLGDKETTLDVVGDDDIDSGRDELNVCSDDEDPRRLLGLHHDSTSKLGKTLTPPHHRHNSGSSLGSGGLSGSTSPHLDCGQSGSGKPRIWSLADVATSTSIAPTTAARIPHTPSHLSGLYSHSTLTPSPLSSSSSSLKVHNVGPDSNANFNPAINGFRPWINGATPPAGFPGASPTSSQTSPSSASGLLRPYSLVRPEVH